MKKQNTSKGGQNRPDSTYLDRSSGPLAELALDLHWSWNHASDAIWSALDPEMWDLTHNPWVILQSVSRQRLETVAADPKFQARVSALLDARQANLAADRWFQSDYAGSDLTSVAYLSMEFMLSEALPIYSGGLGNVAGDQLKAANDLGVPVIGVGLLYQQGYFRQEFDANGAQQAVYPFNDTGQLPIRPLRGPDGEWLRLKLSLPGGDLWIRTWEVLVGRTRLYLLDTNDPSNLPHYRGITSELYGGGPELRLRQELVLGIGGWRLFRALGLRPEVCHLNEGHAAFAVLERARCYMEEQHQPFGLALEVTRAGNLFTTHTPVEAGFDRFPAELVDRYLSAYAEKQLGISIAEVLALGRLDPKDAAEPFNMAYLAVRGSSHVNGVSRLHGEVSRRIFQPLFPHWPEAEVPIGHVTNGVHMPTWDSMPSDALWTSVCGKDRWRGDLVSVHQDIHSAKDEELWLMRAEERMCLIECVRKRLVRQLSGQGAAVEDINAAATTFDSNTLTLGFARRFATYKRPNLLLRDADRFARLLSDPQRPVQLVVAGKAHPNDHEGQAMIREWIQFSRRPDVQSRVVFLSDYDMLLAELLVQGVDVWINTPRRPWEASGTSGMKVLVNGGLNLSELDGWWAEAYAPDVGWAIGDGQEHGNDPEWDEVEARGLYGLLENKIVPEFYTRDTRGIPASWIERVRQSMARLTPAFSSNRAVREYTEKYYLPAASAYLARAAESGSSASKLLEWSANVARRWGGLRFGPLTVGEEGGDTLFEVQVYLDELEPGSVQVELYADAQPGEVPVRERMVRGQALVGAANGFVYSVRLPSKRPAGDYTPRIVPSAEGAVIPIEASQILWQR
jgi:glycogen phosphorylase